MQIANACEKSPDLAIEYGIQRAHPRVYLVISQLLCGLGCNMIPFVTLRPHSERTPSKVDLNVGTRFPVERASIYTNSGENPSWAA